MEFNTQICTTVEQSKFLLELGLKKETADMCWQKTTLNGELITYPAQDVWDCSTAITDYHIPAWSLHRLMELATSKRKVMVIRRGAGLYDTMIRKIKRMIIEGLIKSEYINY